MTAPKHTPGPWGSELDLSDDSGDFIVSSAQRPFVATIHSGFKDTTEANAHLIAAAPKLYEALAELVGWIPGEQAWHTDAPLKAVERARAALAKARGESNG